jgi:hypothetical protein
MNFSQIISHGKILLWKEKMTHGKIPLYQIMPRGIFPIINVATFVGHLK